MFRIDSITFTGLAVISENVSASIKHSVLSADTLSRFYSFRNLAAFFLSKSRHEGETKFSVAVHCPDVVLDEIHLNADVFKFTGKVKSINSITSETTNLTGNNQIELPTLSVLNHFEEGGTLLRLSSCDSFVNVLVDYIPVGMIFRLVAVPLHLIFESRELSLVFG